MTAVRTGCAVLASFTSHQKGLCFGQGATFWRRTHLEKARRARFFGTLAVRSTGITCRNWHTELHLFICATDFEFLKVPKTKIGHVTSQSIPAILPRFRMREPAALDGQRNVLSRFEHFGTPLRRCVVCTTRRSR